MSLTVVGSIAFDSVRTPVRRARADAGRRRGPLLACRQLLHRGAAGRAGRRRLRRRPSSPSWRAAAIPTDDIERVEGGAVVLLARPLRVRPQRRPHRGHPARRLRRLRAEALRRRQGRPTSSSSPTSSPTSSARSAPSAADARFSALDSMNLWIETDEGLAAGGDRRGRVRDRQRRRDPPADRRVQPRPAARAVMEHGPRAVVAKQGEYGAALFTEDGFFALPGYPLEDVRDPTGAGDSFAGGFLGYLDSHRRRPRRRLPAAGDGLRHRARLLQRRGVRHRAGRAPDPRGDRRALRGAARDDAVRRRSRSPAE